MGEVYRAEDSRLHREVAIKVLPSHLADDAQSLERFRREARAIAALSHPNILSIFDFGFDDGVQYAVTEYLEGTTLRSRLATSGTFTARAALELMSEIADGVAAAHARGLVHRDLKPENIFITSSGRVKVLDFGLARASPKHPSQEIAVTEVRPTEPGIVLGTIGYLAPEQVEAGEITAATDVFALGCILYELIAGGVPFASTSSAASMVAVLRDPPPRLKTTGDPLLKAVDELVQHCLEKNPHDRPHDAGELRTMIDALLGGNTKTLRVRSIARRRAYVRIAAIAIALIAVLAIALFAVRGRNRVIDNGYDLRVSDIRGDADTRRLLELALQADATGSRPKAMELLEEASRRPSHTALPPAFLSSFQDAAGNFKVAEQWGNLAMKRIDGASTYESLLVRYLVVASRERTHELSLAKSALELRPNAWRLRLAATHIYLGQRDREAARRELQHIDVRKPDDRRLMFVLADRASLGDVEGAERDLKTSRLVERPAMLHYTQARIAWSRGDARRALLLYDQAADEAAAEGLTPMEAESRLLAGIAQLRLGKWDEASRRFAMAGTRARQIGLTYRIYDANALAAYAAHRGGDASERDRKLLDAASVDPPSGPMIALRLLAIRMKSPVWKSWTFNPDADEAAALPLMRAWEAWDANDVANAKRELQRARAEGVEVSEYREDAELLAAELGLPSQVLPPDPPYPNILRYLAIFDLADLDRNR